MKFFHFFHVLLKVFCQLNEWFYIFFWSISGGLLTGVSPGDGRGLERICQVPSDLISMTSSAPRKAIAK